MKKSVKTAELFECSVPYLRELFEKCEYPWLLLPLIREHAQKIIKNGFEGYQLYSSDVLIGENVKIYTTAVIEGPCVIGSGTEIRPGAFIRGSVITGERCVIGNSSELKNCILLDGVQVPHYNYIGDSVLGNKTHTGAGTICSNLKSDGRAVVIHGERDFETGLRKIGGILADGADIGCGCVINPGTVIGKKTTVYPMTAVRGVIGGGCIVKAMDNIVKRL